MTRPWKISSPLKDDLQTAEQITQDGAPLGSSENIGLAVRRPTAAPQSTAPLPHSTSTSGIRSLSVSHPPIGGSMPMAEVITRLGDYGCQNITDSLNLNSCTRFPVSNGGFGDVYQGKLLDGSQIAIKTMRVHFGTDKAQKLLKHAAGELYTWSKCQHENVHRLLGFVEFHDQIGMVSYWMQNGSLPGYLESNPQADRCRMSTKICEGLAYLHSIDIIHGDLKGPNVLISDNGTPMLTDFGNAILKENMPLTATTTKYALSERWAAPEVVNHNLHSRAADVYALGMTILETITGDVPFPAKSAHGIRNAVTNKELLPRPEDSIPSDSKDANTLWRLLKVCWENTPGSRPSAASVRDILSEITQEGFKSLQVEKYGTMSPMKYLWDAINVGDRLPNPVNLKSAKRRALIAAPQYREENPDDGYKELPSTLNDAINVHKMLVHHGYDLENIRVLTDGFEWDGLSDPTAVNIKQSLDWLVEGARAGDYRFFYFTGHGAQQVIDKGENQQTHFVSVELGSSTTQKIGPKYEMTYFNEAIVASYRRPPRYSSVDKKYHSMIRDKSLNEVLSRLPKGCVLTVCLVSLGRPIAYSCEKFLQCVLDCNCSGRLIGNNAKLAGREFHGGKVFTKISGDDWSLIKAKVITWSACDIGQQAGEVAGLNTGILTTAFTQAVASRIPFPGHAAPCVGEIFDEVEERVRRYASDLEVESNIEGQPTKKHVQYAQLWTSIMDDEKAETFERLKQPFVI